VLVVVCAMLALVSGCGVPDDHAVTTITRVPYDLMQPEPTAPPAPPRTATTRPFVYFLHDQDVVAVEASGVPQGELDLAVGAVLEELSRGPSERDRAAGLTTALGPDTELRLAGLDQGLAQVDVAAGDQVPAPARVPLAVAQVVMTVTSVPGVDSVRLTRDGAPVELPLPGGALTDQPVRASDYASLVAVPSPTSTR
jgi:spore germination protein GerM